MIEAIKVYLTKGKQFKTFREACDYRESLIETFFRESSGFWNMPPKERIAFMESVLNRRSELIDLLKYADEPQEAD